MEQFLRRSPISGVDQSADIDVARGDHSIKRRFHDSIVLQLFQQPDVGFLRGNVAAGGGNGFLHCLAVRNLRLIARLTLVIILAGKDALLGQLLPAVGRNACEFFVRLGLLAIGSGLFQRGLCLLQIGFGLTKNSHA